ncbi:hypothetical protein TARUN_6147 [Trichoderma arundinaceum]|uniref:Uncharacterized protein n=1 Tax=Trichoderma arundinaceum TaxID=490622 RepID=A0A395NIY7_TRIAR|nr:hypothetical protein TARUN_6147 [Trichoderma arundinaceum]
MLSIKVVKITALIIGTATGTMADYLCNSVSTETPLNVGDAQGLQSAIANNEFNPPLANPFALYALQTITFTQDSAKACVANEYVFENTHIYPGDVAFAVNFLIEACGDAGGRFTIEGDSGLQCYVFLQDISGPCNDD